MFCCWNFAGWQLRHFLWTESHLLQWHSEHVKVINDHFGLLHRQQHSGESCIEYRYLWLYLNACGAYFYLFILWCFGFWNFCCKMKTDLLVLLALACIRLNQWCQVVGCGSFWLFALCWVVANLHISKLFISFNYGKCDDAMPLLAIKWVMKLIIIRIQWVE